MRVSESLLSNHQHTTHRKGSSMASQTLGLKYWQEKDCSPSESTTVYWEKHFIYNERNLANRNLTKRLKVIINFGGYAYVCSCSHGGGTHVYWCICTCKCVCGHQSVICGVFFRSSPSCIWGQVSHLNPELSDLITLPHQSAQVIPFCLSSAGIAGLTQANSG